MEDLKNAYYRLNSPISYTSVSNLVKKFKGKYSKNDILNWVKDQQTIQLHRPARKKFPRNFILSHYYGNFWQADLASFDSIKEFNDGYVYILCVIDSLCRYAFTVPLKNKECKSVTAAFEKIFEQTEIKPKYIATDCGTELCGQYIKKNLYDKYKITHIKLRNPEIKASQAERFIRSLKARLYAYFTENNTFRYLDVLDQITKNYNDTEHRSILLAPSACIKSKACQKQAFHNAYYKKLLIPYKKPKFTIGDLVRITRLKGIFEKEHELKWTHEIFKITEVLKRRQPLYKIASLATNKNILGTFQEQELQLVNMPEKFDIERIIRYRGTGDKREALVKWRSWGAEHNSWVKVSDIEQK